MLAFTSINFRTWAKLGQRGAFFGIAIFDVVENYPNTMVLTADLAFLSGLERFMNRYPEKFLNIGIAEQNMLGISAGLAQEGKIPFVTTYATFLAMRSCEQMRHYMGYMQSNIKLVGSGAGLVMGFSGNTHYTIEDMSIARAIPNMVVVSPADATESVKLALAAAQYQGPMYIRLTGGLNVPMVYKEDYEFVIGKAITLRNEGDITIFANGSMVHSALVASDILKEKGIVARVVNMHTVKPLDEQCVIECANTSKLLVSVEEHSAIGGLGGAIAETITKESCSPPLLRLGIADEFKHAGDYNHLLEANELLPAQIAGNIEKRYNTLLS